MRIFCKHEWKVLSESVTVSRIEHTVTLLGDRDFDIPGHLCNANRKHIQIVACDKCGKLKRFVENI